MKRTSLLVAVVVGLGAFAIGGEGLFNVGSAMFKRKSKTSGPLDKEVLLYNQQNAGSDIIARSIKEMIVTAKNRRFELGVPGTRRRILTQAASTPEHHGLLKAIDGYALGFALENFNAKLEVLLDEGFGWDWKSDEGKELREKGMTLKKQAEEFVFEAKNKFSDQLDGDRTREDVWEASVRRATEKHGPAANGANARLTKRADLDEAVTMIEQALEKATKGRPYMGWNALEIIPQQ